MISEDIKCLCVRMGVHSAVWFWVISKVLIKPQSVPLGSSRSVIGGAREAWPYWVVQ